MQYLVLEAKNVTNFSVNFLYENFDVRQNCQKELYETIQGRLLVIPGDCVRVGGGGIGAATPLVPALLLH